MFPTPSKTLTIHGEASPLRGPRALLVRLLSLLAAADLEAAAARARSRKRRRLRERPRRPVRVPPRLRRDLGLPPEIEVPRHWDRW